MKYEISVNAHIIFGGGSPGAGFWRVQPAFSRVPPAFGSPTVSGFAALGKGAAYAHVKECPNMALFTMFINMHLHM